MTTDMEILIPVIIKINLRNLRGYSCPYGNNDELCEDDYRGKHGIVNDALIIKKIREGLMDPSMHPSCFDQCIKRQFTNDTGFLFDVVLSGDRYECYEADLSKIQFIPAEIKAQFVERRWVRR